MNHRNRKKWATAGVSVLLSVSVVAGCNSPAPAKQPDGKPAAQEPPKLQTLTYWVGLASNVAATLKSFGDMTVYKELEKRTGTKVEFQHPPVGQEKDQFNLMITGKNLPDVIEYGWTGYPGGPEKAIKDKKIIKLNELIDKHAPNLKKVLDANPEWKKQVVTDEGSIYGFPFLRGDDYLLVSNGIALRKDWLDKLNLKMPETIDEWYTTLTAIKKSDLNGNGKPDEIPLLISKNDMGGSVAFLGTFGVNYDFYHINGKVSYGPIQPEYKQFLTTMNKWYKEGLLDPDFAVTDSKLKDAKITGNQLFATVMSTGSGIGNYTTLVKDKIAGFKLVAAPFPVVNKGDKKLWSAKTYNFSGGLAAAISTSNKNPEATVKWLDFAYSEEGKMLFNFGVEGVSYKMVNGNPVYTDEVLNPKDTSVAYAMARHVRANFNGPFVQDKRYMEQYASMPEQKDSIKIWSEPTNERKLPQVTPTSDESSKFASIMNDVNTFKDEMFNKFIMGAEPLDNFDKYVKTIEGMGIQDAIKIQQAALERYNKR
ncbi:extracellular solute-binding protein [Paenibacillus sp. GD4]|uniref:extracellular solute-binding protein n=1 Tax=Paenibacillus sp. GD4 TaxID=3068890 RepID=UPI0027966891|nr:extracellular solute-binding protein [Paenibacillus sp. GD4]MDQ1914142.1 extracellular solute-binding protein [Paenibacillus sp. GD4]